jgi:ABC-2 type transport system ATP-binding protein
MLSGILYPTSGEVSVMGFTPWKRQKAFQKQFALVMGQKNQLWWDLPAMESFLLNKAIYQIPDKQFDDMLEELTTLLDVKDILDVQVRKLSLGQRMKCELIAALLHNPRVLFLDEPTIGLDVVSQQHVRSFLKNYNEKFNTTIILTSHDMDDIEALCERVILVDHGSIIFDDALDTLKATYITEKELVVTFTKDMTQQKLEKYGTIKEHTPRRTVFSVPKDESKQIAAKIITEEPIDDILINEPDVEHIIRHLFASS